MQNKVPASGQLHIFFGAAPGVGKTWAMVDAAQETRAEGADVAIGLVDTHDRPEFNALLNGLEVIPLREVEYKGILLREIDLNAILKRHPDVVLIDELAHSNVPGTRNAKRYQDVIELLQAGITVYTTLNVQHVTSIADAVEEITGIKVREQVPDFVLEMAVSIRLIDLEPEELLKRLLKRLREGQNIPATTLSSGSSSAMLPAGSMPTGTQSGEIGEFFKPGNLVTLRELALRVAASRVDEDAHTLVTDTPNLEPWASSSKILIGISASPNSERLIRATRRLVSELRTTWLAVYVETPESMHLPPDARARIQHHLQLAKELGAETLTVAGQSVCEELVEVAKQYGVSRVVVGRSKRRKLPLRLRPSLAEEIIDLNNTIDVLILSG